MFAKIDVNGENTHPLYKYMKENSELYNSETGIMQNIQWNFGKFFLDAEGHVVDYVDPYTSPMALEPFIREQLGLEARERPQISSLTQALLEMKGIF